MQKAVHIKKGTIKNDQGTNSTHPGSYRSQRPMLKSIKYNEQNDKRKFISRFGKASDYR